MSKLLVVDADSLAYTIAYFKTLEPGMDEIEDEDADFIGIDGDDGSADIGWAIEAIDSQIQHWVAINNCSDYQLHLSAGGRLAPVFSSLVGQVPRENFRYKVANDLTDAYKHNRISDPIEGVELVLEAMARHFNSVMHDQWEADDAVVALKRDYPNDIVLAAIDKDVLNQVPGIHFNYRKTEPHVTTESNSIRYAYWQCLVGDPGDGYKGVPGTGKVKADKLLSPGLTEEQMWKLVIMQYKSKGMSEKEALATMRLANMHQLHGNDLLYASTTEWIERAQIELWTPPV